ncbi:hypothetical protein THF5G08_60175 [Vibrio jasicida]|nr:hypothetical protein THF5G08_60175 [Vibrio jasicida]
MRSKLHLNRITYVMDCKFEHLFFNLEFLLKFYNSRKVIDYFLLFNALLRVV